MIELPEAITIGRQVEQTLAGRKVTNVYGATHLHKFTFFNGNPDEYRDLLAGREVKSATGKGIFVDVSLDEDVFLSIFDGINMRYGRPAIRFRPSIRCCSRSMTSRSSVSRPVCTGVFMFSAIRWITNTGL